MYKLCYDSISKQDGPCVQRLADKVFIPFDPNNNDYQTYLLWLQGMEYINNEWIKTTKSNTPLPADRGNN